MNYQVASTQILGYPFTKDVLGVPTFGVPILVFTSIVGQTYSGFTVVNETFVPVLTTDDSVEIAVKVAAFAAAFVITTYPNT